MEPADPQPWASKANWRNWHRRISLAVVAPLLFYALTGVALNHRKEFDYFVDRRSETREVSPLDIGALKSFLDFYTAEIGREDDPAVIRIKDERTVEFLYGSHGQTTYAIDPVAGTMTQTTKQPQEAMTTLNRLHKAFKTTPGWAWISDLLCVAMVLSILTGLAIPGAWARSRKPLLVSSLLFAVLLLVVALLPG